MPRLSGDVEAAAAALRAGEVVAFPTETVYGLGAAAAAEDAIRRVFELKGRPRHHPLIVHLDTADAMAAWAEPVPAEAGALARAFMPGPLTLLLNRKAGVGELAAGGHPTIALRVPASEPARALIALSGGALVAPSANRFGRPSATEAAHVAAEFAGTDLLILDGGRTELGIESTILDLTEPGRPRIARPGALGRAQLQQALRAKIATGSPRAAAGNLRAHYRPRQKVEVCGGGAFSACVQARPDETVAALGFAPPSAIAPERFRQLAAEPRLAARAFYRLLRELEATDATVIVIEELPAEPAWAALANRIERASS